MGAIMADRRRSAARGNRRRVDTPVGALAVP